MTDYQSPPNARPSISKVLQMLDAAEDETQAAIVAALVNTHITIRNLSNIPVKFTAADIVRIARHYDDHVRPPVTNGEGAVEEAIR